MNIATIKFIPDQGVYLLIMQRRLTVWLLPSRQRALEILANYPECKEVTLSEFIRRRLYPPRQRRKHH
jgi:hypothetical protein